VLALNMPLIVPAAYPAYNGVKLNFKSQQKNLEVTTIQVLITIASSFYAAAGNDELVGARKHAIEVAQKTLDNAQVRLAAGVVNKVEVTRAQLALIQAEQRLLEALDARASAYRTLGTLILVDPASFKVQPPGEPAVELDSEDSLIKQAVDRRPELLSLDYQAQAIGKNVFAQWLRWSPTLTLFGNIRLTNATGFAGRPDSYAAGLQLDWLIFDGFARDAQRHLFESQRRDTLLKLEQQRATITDDVVNGRRSVLTRKQGLFTAQRSKQMAEETLDLVRTQYQAGTATQLDLLNAQDTLVQAEVGVAQARFDLSLAVLNIRRLIGDTFIDQK
jgi:outer membrane protein TolC